MNSHAWINLAIYLVVLLLTVKPLGGYIAKVMDGTPNLASRIGGPVERLVYRLCGVRADVEMGWLAYALAIILFNAIGIVVVYAIQRLQAWLPLNPASMANVSPDSSFNTALSFVTNTNWQGYVGEGTMSYLTQMAALAVQNFFSAATGIAVVIALIRGFARHSAATVGNAWADLTRVTLYVLLPLSTVLALVFVSQGAIQNFDAYKDVKTLEVTAFQVPKTDAAGQPVKDDKGNPVMLDQKTDVQTLAMGPVASQEAIKMLGTNGGGYVNANASHPFENPTPLSNFMQMLSIFSIGSGLTYYLGRMVKNQKHGWTVWAAMLALFIGGTSLCWWSETNGNPIHHHLGVASADGNMEGKEVRFGIFNSALFATITTDASCGAVNSMHDSFTPLGGFVPLFNIQLGEIIFGGVGAGLYGMLVFVVLAVFIAGLMVGRTPEYLGKKIESYDVKMAMLALLILAIDILAFAAWAVVSKWGLAGRNNNGPHGLSEILYAFSSTTGNNGSAFAGLNGNSLWYNTTLGIAMLIGRFLMIVPILALAGSLVRKKLTPLSAGTFPVHGGTFFVLLIGTVLLIGALNFLPALTLGPVVEHFLMQGGKLF